jgi:hypothetical protein
MNGNFEAQVSEEKTEAVLGGVFKRCLEIA